MVKILVLGGSFGGLAAAFEPKRLPGKKSDITVISDDNKFVFVPSLPWVSIGWRKTGDITLPIKAIPGRRGISFLHEKAAPVIPPRQDSVFDEGRRFR